MSKVKIVTDSTCDLPPELIKELDITVVPLYAIFGEESFKEGVEITLDRFYELLQSSPHHPKTSQPTPQDFVTAYEALEGNSIVSIHLSADLSGTYESAQAAAKQLEGADITIIDTRTTTVGLGLIVAKAARAAAEGATLDEIRGLTDSLMSKLGFYFSVDTLEYLHKGGRIGKAQELLGSLLKVKPILTIENGVVTPKGKVRGRAKVFSKLIELMKEKGAGAQPLTIMLAGVQNEERIEAFRKKLTEEFEVEEFIISKVGAVIGTHTGPGVVMCSWI